MVLIDAFEFSRKLRGGRDQTAVGAFDGADVRRGHAFDRLSGRDNAAVLVSAVCAGGVLALLSAFAPALLRLPNLLWFRFSMLLQKVVNPIVMFTIFAVVVVPGGLLMRFFRDPLRARRDPKLTTYWVERTGDEGLFHAASVLTISILEERS